MAFNIKKEPLNLNLIKKSNGTFYLNPTNSNEIFTILKNMPNKAGGVDNLNTKVLKNLAPYFVPQLEYIFNLCFIYQKWPASLKIADIIPIYKSGDKHCTTNYRPYH